MFLLIIYLVANSIAFLAFALDKWQAGRDGWRVRETTLLGLAFLGPFGALGGMLLLRHKTRKFFFLLVPAFVFLHGIFLWILVLGLP